MVLCLLLQPGARLNRGCLNEHELTFTAGEGSELVAELQDHLQPYNVLKLTISCSDPDPHRFSDVAAAELRL